MLLRRFWWFSGCWPGAISPASFCLGVRKGGEDGTDPAGLAAHAWLQCGGVIVNGGGGHEDYTVVSAFSWGKLTRGSGLE